MAARGRGRGRGAAAAIGEDANEGMNGLEAENGNAVLNQAVEGMNAAMQAMQEMMQQQQQMFQQQQANQMQMFQQLLQANMAQMGAGQQAQAAAGGGNLNPPPPHLTPEEIAQERWLKTLERYKKLAPKTFERGDATAAFNWLTDVERICTTMGVDELAKRKLVATSLHGDAGQWYHLTISADQEQNMTWEEFVEMFERQYISKAVRNEKQVELCRIQQKEHEPIEEYDERFLSLCRFVDRHMPEDRKVSLYQAGLNNFFRQKVMAHNFTTQKAASDSARSIQVAFNAGLSHNREKAKDDKEKRKASGSGDRDNSGNSQQQGQNKKVRADFRKKFDGTCNFCGIVGHKIAECRKNPENRGKLQFGQQQFRQNQGIGNQQGQRNQQQGQQGQNRQGNWQNRNGNGQYRGQNQGNQYQQQTQQQKQYQQPAVQIPGQVNALLPDQFGQGQWVLVPNVPALPAPAAVPALPPPPPTATRLAFLPGNQANGAMVEGNPRDERR